MPHVLVIDDDEEIRESVVEALQDMGHPAFGVANGKAALEMLNKSPLPCLILLDLMMPVMDGLTFREEQLKDPALASVPVLVISAYRDVAEKAQEMQASAWLQKPLKLDDLFDVVKQHCAG